MKNVLIFFFAVLSLTSCLYKAWYYFSEEDEKWLAPYNQGDVLLFSCGNETDTITVVEKSITKDSKSIFVPNEGANNTFNASGSIRCTLKRQGYRYGVPIWLIVIKESDDILSLSIRFDKRRYHLNDTKNVVFYEKNIDGTILEDIVSIDSRNSELFHDEDTTPVSFLWSKSKGLLQYKYKDGDVYTRVF